jgi:hypothetical protein
MAWRISILAAALVLAAARADAQFVLVTDCTKLSLRLQGIPEAAGVRCNGDDDQRNETIDASGAGSTFVIRHQGSLRGYYLIREEVTGLVRKMAASGDAQDIGEPFEIANFDVVRYRGLDKRTKKPAPCFHFLRYSGHVARTTGYRHAIIGFYCSDGDTEASETRIAELLGAIDADFW